jgi:hypothetical protein
MRYLANVLTDNRAFFNGNVLYNVVKTESELIEGIPTLIVGWDKVKTLYPDASILEWKINDLVYWTYGRRVKREKFEEDVDKFKKIVFDRVSKSVTYEFFSVLTANTEEKKAFYSFLKDSEPKYMLLKNNMVYIYNVKNNKTIGINLSDIDYEGGDRTKLLRNLFNNSNITTVKEQDYISSETRELVNNKRYIIPYLSSKTA